MRRVLISALGFIGLAGASLLSGCDAVEANRQAIEESCLANGEPGEVCACLARESAERLDPSVLELIAMGAKGEGREASEKAKTLETQLRSQFAVEVPAIMDACGFTPP